MTSTVKVLDQLVVFLEDRKKAHKEYMDSRGYNWDEPINMTTGKKYAKLISGSGVEAFIDLMTGDIYKPASWNAPAKHVRGNIFNDLGRDAFDPQGNVKYLR